MAKVQKTGPKRISVLYPLPNTSGPGKSEEMKLRIAAYCRVSSSSDEQLTSYNAQINYYEKYIKEHHDYDFVGIYADEGISGTGTKKRDAFNRLMQDARSGKIDMIITKSLSRFGRNTVDFLKSIRELKALGIDIYFEKENIHTMKSEGEMLLTLISAVAENESYSQSENVKWGIRRKYERGDIKSIPSGKFLGYTKDGEGNLIINEQQAVIVRRIYQEFLDGFGTYQIAKRLTDENVTTTYGGKEWCASHIIKVLTNEKIKGDTKFLKTYNADPLTKRRIKNRGEHPQYYSENTHPAIIDKETWQLVQLEFERQAQFSKAHYMYKFHHHSEEFPLSGKIICGTCGNTYIMLESKRVGEEFRKYWRCRSFHKKQGTPIEGRTFNPKPPHRYSTNLDVIRRRKEPEARQMFCTDFKFGSGEPIQAFINAWNHLIDNKNNYLSELQQTIAGSDILKGYRAKEMIRLIEETEHEETEHIETMPYELMLKTLDHIEVGKDGSLEVIFLAGIKIEY